MSDPLSQTDRSKLMSKVRSKGNRSTELRAVAELERLGINGWTRHPDDILGHPDIFFPDKRLAVFLDGCFWHGCPKCGRLPKSREDFWETKIAQNRSRDRSTTRRLRADGYKVIRIWEHALKDGKWSSRLSSMLRRQDLG